MAVADTLALWGILRPAEIVELAAAAGLDLACAVTMIEKESGGRNVWGSDGVSTGGAYVKGAVVTEAAYRAYRTAQDAGLIGAQGVGPAQLTYPPLQRAADALGGCWDWRCNVTVGFRHLAQLQRAYGVRDGFRRYNGSGAAAERYADDAMARLNKWRARIGTAPVSPPAPPPVPAPSPAPAPAPVPVERSPHKEEPVAPIPITLDAARSFQAAVGAEAGGGSQVATRGWVTFGSTFGPTVFTRVAALAASGDVLAKWENVTVSNNTSLAYELPPGTRAVTIQGVADNAGTRPWASYWGVR